MKNFLRAFEKQFRLGLVVILPGSSFHNFGPEKSMKRLSDSSLEIDLVKLVRSLLRKLLDKLSGRNPFFNLQINLAFFSSIDFSRGKISKFLKRGSVGWSLSLKEIMRTAFFYFKVN